MVKLKFCIVAFSLVIVSACGSPDQDQETTSDNSVDTQLLKESDSLSNELSTASDSVEKKMNELQSALDNLNN